MQRSSATPHRARLACGLFVALILLLLATSLWPALVANVDSDGGDQGAFLSLGLRLRAGQSMSDGTRHPLFAALMAPFAQRDWAYFTTSKLLSAGCTLLSVLAVMVFGARLLGWPAALLAGAALASSSELIGQGSQVLAEGLLAGLAFLSFVAVARLVADPDDWRRGVLAGAALSLVYLCKSTGTMLLGAAIVALFVLSGWRVLRKGGFWAMVVAFCAVASPLLIYNVIQHGNPLYSFDSTHAMWFNSWDDRYLAPEQWPTFATYLADHTLAEIAERLGRGLVGILPVMAEALRLGDRAWTGWALLAGQGAIVVAAVVLVIRGWVRRAAEPRPLWQTCVVVAGVRIGVLYVMHAWFAQVTDAPRFFLPLAPETLLLIGGGLAWIWRRWLPHVDRRPGVVAWVACGWALLLLGARMPGLDRVNVYATDAAANAAAGQVVEHLNALAADQPLRVLFGPSHSLPRWYLSDAVELMPIPDDTESPAALDAVIAGQGIDLILLDKKMYTRRRAAIEPRFDKSGETILFRQAWLGSPGCWQYLRSWRGPEMHWYLLEPMASASRADLLAAGGNPIASFGPAISLLDHAFRVDPASDGQTIEVVLRFRAEAPIDQNLTLFCHALDASGQRIAQHDGPPLGGMYPTYLWQPGDIVLDTVTLPIGDASAQPAQVLVGWYDWSTKERPTASSDILPVTEEGRAVVVPVR